jgi:hypothetical protein
VEPYPIGYPKLLREPLEPRALSPISQDDQAIAALADVREGAQQQAEVLLGDKATRPHEEPARVGRSAANLFRLRRNVAQTKGGIGNDLYARRRHAQRARQLGPHGLGKADEAVDIEGLQPQPPRV